MTGGCAAPSAAHVVVRDARLDDARAILELQRAAYRIEAVRYSDFSLPPLIETLDDLWAAYATHTIIVAEHEGPPGAGPVLVGSVRARVIGDVAHVARLAVRPDLHGRGVGRRLLQAIEQRVAPVRRYQLYTGHRSERALRMYERAGYHRTRTVRDSATVSLVHMTKAVARPADR